MASGRAQIGQPSELDQALDEAKRYLALATQQAGEYLDYEVALKLAQVNALVAIAQGLRDSNRGQ